MPESTGPSPRSRRLADVGPRPVRGDSGRLDLEGDEPLCATRRPPRSAPTRSPHPRVTRRTTSSVPIEPTSSSATAATMHVAAQPFPDRVGTDEHDRGEASLHVAGPAAVQPAVLDARLERRLHAGTPTVSMCAFRRSDGRRPCPRDADDVGPAGRRLVAPRPRAQPPRATRRRTPRSPPRPPRPGRGRGWSSRSRRAGRSTPPARARRYAPSAAYTIS